MEGVFKIAVIGIGGALGAVARHLVNISPAATAFKAFPLATFLINVSGSFFIGFMTIALAEKFDVGENLRAAVIVGFLGAFTTFSTFEMEIFTLTGEKQVFLGLAYAVLSVIVGFAGVAAGVALANRL
jgi:CrcB protein